MTLHEDVARINEGDTVTAEFRHGGRQYEITGPAYVLDGKKDDALMLGPFTLGFTDGDGAYANANLLRVVAHTPKPAPLYANRPDIKAPRPYDVVAADDYPGGELMPLTYWNGAWRAHTGSRWTTDELLAVGPLTLVGAAIP